MYTFLTVLHVIVSVFLVLVVLLQAGRGGGIGLAFGGSGGSQSVFGSSGGANFMTKLTAVCAFIFFTNSMALAYLSSQSDSRRLQKIAERNVQAKKAEEAASSKLMTDIDKQREAKAKAEAEAQAAKTEGVATEGTATDEQAPAAEDKAAADKAAPALKLTDPGKPVAPVEGKLAADLKLGKAEATEKKADKPAKPIVEKKPAAEKKPVAVKKPAASDDKPAEEGSAEDKPAKKQAAEPAAEKKSAEPAEEKPAAE